MLTGIKIIDFTNYLPGPFATMRLADLGAEVIKIESPKGDPARHTGEGLVFRANNRGKKSIVLDLKKQSDVDAALALLSTADAVVESFRPGVMSKLGLSYQDVVAVKPDIVYCSISGYGQSGAMRHLGSHDLNYLALSGVLAQLKDASGRPVHPTITLADYFGGFAANERLLAGIVNKLVSGQGSYHSISIADVLISLMGNHVLLEQATGAEHGVDVLGGNAISYAIYETKDGRFISLAALEPKFWSNFCSAIGKQDWVSSQFSPTERTNAVYGELVSLFKSKTFHEWISFSQSVDCCMTPVLEVGELAEYPYFKEKELIFDPEWAEADYQVKMHSDRGYHSLQPPPKLGEHNAALFQKK